MRPSRLRDWGSAFVTALSIDFSKTGCQPSDAAANALRDEVRRHFRISPVASSVGFAHSASKPCLIRARTCSRVPLPHCS